MTAGLNKDGGIIINTDKPKEEFIHLLKGYEGKIYTIDARTISMETLGKYFPNSPMLAAIVNVSGIMSKDDFLSQMLGSYQHKFAKKPEVIEGNMKALERAFSEVR